MEYISFPHLGWTFHINPELFHFSLFGMDFSIKWYGLIIAVGFLLAMIYAFKRAKEFHIDPDRMIDVVLVSALFAFVGARLYYVVFSGAFDWSDPGKILAVWDGGLAIYGGVIFAFLTALWMCRLRKVDTLRMFDLASLGFLIGQGIGRWGNFFNQEAFGGNTTMPWGMTGSIIQTGATGNSNLYDTSLPVHPTFLYESLWCLLGLLVLHLVSKKAYKFKGQIFALYIMWYGAGRFVIEGLRTDSLYFGVTGIRISQVVAILSVLGGLALLFVLRAYSRRLPKELPAIGEGEAFLSDTDEKYDPDEVVEESTEDSLPTDQAAEFSTEVVPSVENTEDDTGSPS